MTLSEFGVILDRIFNTELFKISGTPVSLVSLVTFLLFILLAILVSRGLRRGSQAAMDRRGVHDPGVRVIVSRLIHILIMAVGVSMALSNVGVNLAAFFAAGAVFAVGIGLAFQNVAQNFLSGMILLLERSIKPGDVLEVEGDVIRVERLGVRATVARTRDDEQVIIPNTILAQNSVKNYTMQDSIFRIRVMVGVTYDSDMRRVRATLEEAVQGVEHAGAREPVVFMREFADSSVNFEASVWTDDPWRAPGVASELHEAIWFGFQEAGVVIAFPQLDVHFDPAVDESLSRLPRAS